jgi:hypothetical protein
VRVLTHIKKLDDCFGQPGARELPVRHLASHRTEALARLAGWATTLKALAPRLCCSQCGKRPFTRLVGVFNLERKEEHEDIRVIGSHLLLHDVRHKRLANFDAHWACISPVGRSACHR